MQILPLKEKHLVLLGETRFFVAKAPLNDITMSDSPAELSIHLLS
jgi:hypothetical protein